MRARARSAFTWLRHGLGLLCSPLANCASSENYIRTIARYIDHVVIHWQPPFSLRFLRCTVKYRLSTGSRATRLRGKRGWGGGRRSFDLDRATIIFSWTGDEI